MTNIGPACWGLVEMPTGKTMKYLAGRGRTQGEGERRLAKRRTRLEQSGADGPDDVEEGTRDDHVGQLADDLADDERQPVEHLGRSLTGLEEHARVDELGLDLGEDSGGDELQRA
jgi:hypothetical protein